MSPTPSARRLRTALATGLVLALAGCARVAPPAGGGTGGGVRPGPTPTVAAGPVQVTPSPTPAPIPTPVGSPEPIDPWQALTPKTRARFTRCSRRTVGPGSSGACARLAVVELKAAHHYPWAVTSRITVAGANAILNYQRSRGLKATATITRATWLALAANTPALPVDLPRKCSAKGVVLCVDQAHRRLFWLRDGRLVKTVRVRLGGWNNHPKKPGQWRLYPTANGTWRVYDKQVNPRSENYGSGAMPYSVIFYPDMYVHYSPGFRSVGYAGSSHGCVNVGSLAQASWLFRHTPIGARVHIFSTKA